MTLADGEDRRNTATEHLPRLADALDGLGLTADVRPLREPYPGLALTFPACIGEPADAITVLAGSRHYWCKRPSGVLELIGSLDEPHETAIKLRDRIRARRTR